LEEDLEKEKRKKNKNKFKKNPKYILQNKKNNIFYNFNIIPQII
jgi:hypothetical protein